MSRVFLSKFYYKTYLISLTEIPKWWMVEVLGIKVIDFEVNVRPLVTILRRRSSSYPRSKISVSVTEMLNKRRMAFRVEEMILAFDALDCKYAGLQSFGELFVIEEI